MSVGGIAGAFAAAFAYAMPFYTYDTVPLLPGDPVRRYELWQPLRNDSWRHHPETGEPLRRVFLATLESRRGGAPVATPAGEHGT